MMNEQEDAAFRAAYRFLAKYRETVLENDEQWLAYAREVGQVSADLDGNPLAQFLLGAVVEYIGFLYKDGMKPMPANYFGRDDI